MCVYLLVVVSLYSWLGMLPGTWAYVSAGAVGRAIIVNLHPLKIYIICVLKYIYAYPYALRFLKCFMWKKFNKCVNSYKLVRRLWSWTEVEGNMGYILIFCSKKRRIMISVEDLNNS